MLLNDKLNTELLADLKSTLKRIARLGSTNILVELIKQEGATD